MRHILQCSCQDSAGKMLKLPQAREINQNSSRRAKAAQDPVAAKRKCEFLCGGYRQSEKKVRAPQVIFHARDAKKRSIL